MDDADPGEGTRLKYVRPTIDLSDDWITRLREVLKERNDIVAAYWVATVYFDAAEAPSQHELHFELSDPPTPGTTGATPEMVEEIARILPRSDGPLSFTFPPSDRLPGVRRAGVRVY